MIEDSKDREKLLQSLMENHSFLSRQAAEEGIVLMRNENDVLPLSSQSKLAVFGMGVEFTVKGGSGSGDVNTEHNISILDGLKANGISIVNTSYLERCSEDYLYERLAWKERILSQGNNGRDLLDVYFTQPFRIPSGPRISYSDIEEADVAVYVISRTAGEGLDRFDEKGDYCLSDTERYNIDFLIDNGIHTVLILNTSGPIELPEKLPDAILDVSQLGQEGGYAIVNALLGKSNPSGRLTSSWPYSYRDVPFSDEFNSGKDEYYREGIYVGYRYFTSFDVPVAYPFGFGLSYTEFQYSNPAVTCDGNLIRCDTICTNVGNLAGKEVMQLYVRMPGGISDSENIRLAGFAKTEMLEPGQSEIVSIYVHARELGFYCVEKSSWMIRAGRYGVCLGRNCNAITTVAVIDVEDDIVISGAKSLDCPNVDALVNKTEAWESDAPCIKFNPVFSEMQTDGIDVDDSIAAGLFSERDIEDWIPLLCGWQKGSSGALGNASESIPGAAGETCPFDGLKNVVMADGPAGLRLQPEYDTDVLTGEVIPSDFIESLENGFFAEKKKRSNVIHHEQYCTAFPVGTALAQTWNVKLVEKVGIAQSEELAHFGINWFLAPGMNIQRNPLCGRNFEYYSEDPFLTGTIASAMVKGIQSIPSIGATLKHFALNNRENDRMQSNSIVGERALREIYLKGFEIAIRNSDPECVMSSYNCINGIHAANCKWLLSDILRKEFGFGGIVMTDWTTTSSFGGSIPYECISSGNDLIMPGAMSDEINIREALASGKLDKSDLEICIKRILKAIIHADGIV